MDISTLIQKATAQVEDNCTKCFHFEQGEFFDGGEFTCSISKLSASESLHLGLGAEAENRRLYCEGRFFSQGIEYHFTLVDYGGKNWSINQMEAGVVQDSWESSTNTYAHFPLKEDLYQTIAKALEIATA